MKKMIWLVLIMIVTVLGYTGSAIGQAGGNGSGGAPSHTEPQALSAELHREDYVNLYVKGINVNLRDAPSTKSKVLKRVSEGAYFLSAFAEPVDAAGAKWFRCFEGWKKMNESGAFTMDLPDDYGAEYFYISADFVRMAQLSDSEWERLQSENSILRSSLEKETPKQAPVNTKTAAASNTSTDDFIKLCATGTPQQIEAAIEAGADVNAQLVNDWKTTMPPHIEAFVAAEIDEDRLGSDWNTVNYSEGTMTPLLAAVIFDNKDGVAVLLKAGADVNVQNKVGLTALMAAVSRFMKNPEILTMLLEAGGDVNVRNEHGLTVLHLAASNRNPEFVTILLNNGADTNILTDEGKSALDLARTTAVAKILRGEQLNPADYELAESCIKLVLALRPGIEVDEADRLLGRPVSQTPERREYVFNGATVVVNIGMGIHAMYIYVPKNLYSDAAAFVAALDNNAEELLSGRRDEVNELCVRYFGIPRGPRGLGGSFRLDIEGRRGDGILVNAN